MFRSIVVATAVLSLASASPLLDSRGTLQLATIPDSASSASTVAIITSPGTPSVVLGETSDETLTYDAEANQLICRGATLQGSSTTSDRTALALCALTAPVIVVDGITTGDAQSDITNTRHARTLTAIFRGSRADKATLLLVVSAEEAGDDDDIVLDTDSLKAQLETLYNAVKIEKSSKTSFSDAFDVQIFVAKSPSDAPKILEAAKEAASGAEGKPLFEALTEANTHIRSSGMAELAMDPPNVASAYLTLGTVSSELTRRIQAQLLAWKRRTARGLSVDDLGESASSLRQSVLDDWDTRTRAVTGFSTVGAYRRKLRQQLVDLLDTGITVVFEESVAAIQATALKRLRKAMVKTALADAETQVERNAQALRQEGLYVDTSLEKLQVPVLGLTREKVVQDVIRAMNDAVMAFPDSPDAKLLRLNKVKQVVNKEKKPGERSVQIGLDLVAMLRPDGFGSFSGYAAYALPGGNSITVGVQNDADDPTTIAQLGGVRPPFLRVQPKLKVDVEM